MTYHATHNPADLPQVWEARSLRIGLVSQVLRPGTAREEATGPAVAPLVGGLDARVPEAEAADAMTWTCDHCHQTFSASDPSAPGEIVVWERALWDRWLPVSICEVCYSSPRNGVGECYACHQRFAEGSWYTCSRCGEPFCSDCGGDHDRECGLDPYVYRGVSRRDFF